VGVASCEDAKEPTAATADEHSAAPRAVESAVPALDVSTQGTLPLPVEQSIGSSGVALGITQTSSGGAGSFAIANPRSLSQALLATNRGAGAALYAQTVGTGTGGAGVFSITNGNNAKPALAATTVGKGPAGVFTIANTTNGKPALSATTSGTGLAFEAASVGGRGAGEFRIEGARNLDVALHAFTLGTGTAGSFQIFNSSNGSPAVLATTIGSGAALSASSAGGTGLEVDAPQSFFFGNLLVSGTLTKSAGSFRIDHPLDPEHKYLSHSFVESPEMLNVYNGNVAVDSVGRATVELPDWFEALNRDFRYQLTPIGAPGPNLYIAAGVRENRFQIAGGRPYATVSWQVTGVRHDAYAETHRIPVEEEKPAFGGAREPKGFEHRGLESPRIDDSPDSVREHVRSNGTHRESLP
jgi:hypothetical protein